MQNQQEPHQTDTAEIYNEMLLLMDNQDQSQKDTYDKIRYGIELKFDIYHYISQTLTIDPKKQTVIIGNEEHNLSEYWTEMEKRRIMIQTFIAEHSPDELTKPRGL